MDEDVACRDLTNHNRYLIHYCFLSFYITFLPIRKRITHYNFIISVIIVVLLFGRCGCAQYTGHVSVLGIRNVVCTWPCVWRYLVSTISILLLLVVFYSILNLWFMRPASGALGGIRCYAVIRLPNYIPSYTPEADIGIGLGRWCKCHRVTIKRLYFTFVFVSKICVAQLVKKLQLFFIRLSKNWILILFVIISIFLTFEFLFLFF